MASSTRTGQSTKAWEALSPCLPSRTPDLDYWWALTGMHLAIMLEAGGYSIEKQCEALIFRAKLSSVARQYPTNLQDEKKGKETS
ncbi:hypothetical protein BJY01DRAFT_224778 [Aspergillus pseudoustus]|uniref:Uncharacterized protein n=1 Tax=Aspergillus pseudoustus TaxID=1810923 RepID=A0ABR4J1X8_9EURO